MDKKQEQIQQMIEQVLPEGKLLSSLQEIVGGWVVLVETELGKRLVGVFTKNSQVLTFFKAEKEAEHGKYIVKVMELNANNAAVIRRFVKGVTPQASGTKGLTVGFCDWLEKGSTKILPLFTSKHMKPILAEFTANEVVDSGRNFLEVIDIATWAVFEQGYKEGYGAAAVGLATEEDIVKTLLYGYSCIGLDYTFKINYAVDELTTTAINFDYEQLPEEFRASLEESYTSVPLKLSEEVTLIYTPEVLRRIIMKYGEFIMHIQSVYNSYLFNTPWEIDLELQLAAAGKSLTPEEHYLVGNELTRNKFKISTVNGLFSTDSTYDDYVKHAIVAEACGYRLSVDGDGDGMEFITELVKKSRGRLHIKLDKLLFVAALEVVEATDSVLFDKVIAVAEVTKENLVTGEVIMKLMAPINKTIITEVQQNIESNAILYTEKIAKLAKKYLDF